MILLIVVIVLAAAGLLFYLWGRRGGIQVRPLSEEARQVYEADWSRLQERFVDAPTDAVTEADKLLTSLLAEIGYPATEFDERADALAKRDGKAASSYRKAHDALSNRSTTDDAADPPTDELRHALLDYRSVFDAVVGRREHTSSKV
jgi:hypothetical protein